MNTHQHIINFWFETLDNDDLPKSAVEKRWWQQDDTFDQSIKSQFANAVQECRHSKVITADLTAQSCLASVLLLDQFTRNIYRNSSLAFESDPTARVISQFAIGNHFNVALKPIQRVFLYLPFEHSESIDDQKYSLSLFTQLHDSVSGKLKDKFMGYLEFAKRHAVVIERFGRFPHRNIILDRASSKDELAFLASPQSPF